jgi:hypothetical protein
MPYPNSNILNIVIPQTSASLQGGQAPFVERIISGSNLILQTDSTGTLIGSSDLNVNNITASNISASGFISASNLRVENSIVDGGTLTVLGNVVLGDVVSDTIRITGSTSLSGSFSVVGTSTFNGLVSASRIVASEITASNELFIGTGRALRTYGEAFIPENLAKLYVSGSVSVVSKYATLNLATSASDAGAQSSILFSKLSDRDPGTGLETVLEPRMQLGTESGSNDLRLYAYYISSDPDNIAQSAGSNIVAGTRAIFKQSGYFGVGSFISYGVQGGAKTTYVSSLPGYAGITGPDAMLTILPMDSASFGTAASKQYNRNILNIMNYDTSSIMFISGSDGYVLLGRNTTDGFNRLQVAGNVSASAYTGSSANFTSLIATNFTSSNISASGNISASTLVVTGTTTLGNIIINNLTASNISASGNISSSTLYVSNNATINGNLKVNGNSILGDSLTDVNTSSGSLKVLNANNATSYTDTTSALQVDGGARISKDTWISGSLNVAGDFTVFGSSSVVYISSSTVIINDNIIQLNAYFPYERYAGFEVFDSGSNQRSASLLWDGQTDNWTTVDQNNSASNIIIGPTASFGSAIPNLTVNRLTKAYEGNGITDSSLSDDGNTLSYTGTTISSSRIIATTGSITYITGALVTYVTGSFTTLTISTGSSPQGGGIVPSHPTASGMPGQINVDNNFVYVYTNNIWKRVPLSTWSL